MKYFEFWITNCTINMTGITWTNVSSFYNKVFFFLLNRVMINIEDSFRNYLMHEKIYIEVYKFIGTNLWMNRSSFEASLWKIQYNIKNRKISQNKKNLFSPNDTFLSVKRFSFKMCIYINSENASGIPNILYSVLCYFEDARVLYLFRLFPCD